MARRRNKLRTRDGCGWPCAAGRAKSSPMPSGAEARRPAACFGSASRLPCVTRWPALRHALACPASRAGLHGLLGSLPEGSAGGPARAGKVVPEGQHAPGGKGSGQTCDKGSGQTNHIERFNNTLQQHASTTRFNNTLQQHASTTRFNNTLQQHAAPAPGAVGVQDALVQQVGRDARGLPAAVPAPL